LYGKFGQRSRPLEQIEIEDEDIARSDVIVDTTTGEVRNLYKFGSTYWIQVDHGEAYNSFPAIAAHVTAYARMHLWHIITRAGRDHVFYTDTDSVIVDAVGYERLQDELDEQRLGALKVEHTADTITIRAPKCYTFGETTKRKGIPAKALETAPDTWSFDAFPSFRRQCRTDTRTSYRTTRTSRHLSYRIYDGTPGLDGWIVPFDARDLDTTSHITDDDAIRIAELQAEKSALAETVPVDARTMFLLYDHRHGTFRRQRNKNGELVELEYSNWDSRATELGFHDLTALKDAVLQTLRIRQQMQTIDETIRDIMNPQIDIPDNEPLPF